MKRKPTDIIFKVEHQFTLYLQRAGVSREILPPVQYTETRRAFYGAAGQFFFLLTQDIAALPGASYIPVLNNIRDEIQEFWNKEQTDHLNGRQEYATQLMVKCSMCTWQGAVADLVKPEKGAADDRCKCPSCGTYELMVPEAVAPGPKPWQPVLVNPKAYHTHDAYGITDERRRELADKMGAIHKDMLNTVTPLHYRIDQLSQIAENAAEFAFCLYVDTAFMVKNGFDL
jgi:hypothetical protein